MNHVHSVMVIHGDSPWKTRQEKQYQLRLAFIIAAHVINPDVPMPQIIEYVDECLSNSKSMQELMKELKEMLGGNPSD